MKLNFSVFRTMTLSALLLWGMALQARVITGTVKDPTGETIISASVVVKGSTIGTVTDFDGNYTLEVPDDAQVLIFSYIGMKTQELNITGDVMNVVLSENSEVLEEVVVTGYGTTKKRDLVTAVSSVNADQLKDIPVVSASEALQGKLAGVSVTTTEGGPDADVKIRVRGGTSLTQSNDPLYIVDGFQVSSISDISPTDIQSMDVLKGAAATAIYGAQGANGVIIITTKDADNNADDKMQIHFDYTGYMGWKQMAKKYDMLDLDDFILLQYEYAHYKAKANANNIPSNFNQYFDPQYAKTGKKEDAMAFSDVLNYWHGDDIQVTDWQDKTFGHHGLNSNHSFTVSGGNKAANFSLSYNRIDDEGIMYGSDYNRNNLNFKAKFKPIKDLTLSFTARYSNTEILGSGTNTATDAGSKTESRVRNAVAYSPIELFAKDNVAGLDDYESFGSLYDPITTIDHNYRRKLDNKYTLQGYVSYKFAKMFTWKTDVGFEGRYQSQDRYYGPTTYYSRAGEGFTYAGGVAGYGHVVATEQKDTRFKNTNTLEFKKKWGSEHDLGILIGEEMQILTGELRTNNGYGYDPSLTGKDVFNYIGSAKAYTEKSYVNPTDNMLSFFISADYVLFSKYYIKGTFRTDASTRFAKGNQWGYFPAMGVAWRLSDEAFMEGAASWLSNLKLRFDYGSIGNNNVDLGYLYPEYLASSAAYSGLFDTKLADGGADVIAANNKLKWETTITRDLGIDYGFFNERLSGSIDLYWNNTKDLILKYKMAVGGYNYQYRNIGSTDNKGVEFSVNAVILDHRSKSLSYGLTFNGNISHNYNKVVDLGGMDEYLVSSACFSSNYSNTDYEFKLKPGSKVGDIYGYQTAGWYTPADFVSYNPSNNRWYAADGKAITSIYGEARPGTVKIVDQNGDGVIDDADRVVLGNTQADVQGGFGLSFHIGGNKWGKFDVNAQFTYSVGNEVVNLSALDYGTIFDKSKLRNNTSNVAYGKRYSLFTKTGGFIPSGYVGGDGTVSGDNYAAMAAELAAANANAITANPISDNIALTDKYVENASFLRMSAITVGYSLPERWLEKAHIQTARIFFTGSNIFCVTPYSGADPEVDTRSKVNPLATGVDFSAFPKSRAFNFGLNLSF